MTSSRRARALVHLTAFAVLGAILACGVKREPREGADPATEPAAAPSTELVLPDAVMPLTEGGELQDVGPDANTVIARFPEGDFDALVARIRTWMPEHGWTMVEGSEIDSERNARNLEEMGMQAAADLARQTPSFGASYQQAGETVAVTLMVSDGAYEMHLDWL